MAPGTDKYLHIENDRCRVPRSAPGTPTSWLLAATDVDGDKMMPPARVWSIQVDGTLVTAKVTVQRPREMQERIRRIEQSSALIRGFQPAMVIDLVQTVDYARAMMSGRVSGQTLQQLTQSRRERQSILNTDRHVTLLHAEGALRWHIGSPTIMAAQLDHLAELTRRPNLQLGVIPWDRPLAMHARHAFHLYDTHTVIVGTESGTAFITDPVEVAAYDRRFAELEDVAVFGDEAAQVFERVAGDYRDLA